MQFGIIYFSVNVSYAHLINVCVYGSCILWFKVDEPVTNLINHTLINGVLYSPYLNDLLELLVGISHVFYRTASQNLYRCHFQL